MWLPERKPKYQKWLWGGWKVYPKFEKACCLENIRMKLASFTCWITYSCLKPVCLLKTTSTLGRSPSARVLPRFQLYAGSKLLCLCVGTAAGTFALTSSSSWPVWGWGRGTLPVWCWHLLLSLSDITWQTCTGKENLGCPLQSPNDKEAFQIHRCYVSTESVPKELAPLRTTRESQALSWGEAGGWKIQGHLQLRSGFKNLPQNKNFKKLLRDNLIRQW